MSFDQGNQNLSIQLHLVYDQGNTEYIILIPYNQRKPPGKEKKAKEVGSPPEMLSPPSTGEGEKRKLVTQDTLDSPSLSQTPSVSSEDPLSPVVRRKYWGVRMNLSLHGYDMINFICLYHPQLQNLDQEQPTLHRRLSNRQMSGCLRFPCRSMCSLSAPERGSWDYLQPCCHQPNQYVKPVFRVETR